MRDNGKKSRLLFCCIIYIFLICFFPLPASCSGSSSLLLSEFLITKWFIQAEKCHIFTCGDVTGAGTLASPKQNQDCFRIQFLFRLFGRTHKKCLRYRFNHDGIFILPLSLEHKHIPCHPDGLEEKRPFFFGGWHMTVRFFRRLR